MFRNYLATALRNLARNKLYAAVTILGLSIGFTAALLIGLYVRDEFTFDRWVPGHERVIQVNQSVSIGGAPWREQAYTPMMLARPLKAEFNELEYVARLSPSYFPPTVRRGDIVGGELQFMWADADFFRIFPLPVVSGSLSGALDTPDSIVITQTVARKYFGSDAVAGRTLLVNGQPMRITAVLKDLPGNTHHVFELVASAKAAQSPITVYEPLNGPLTNTLITYARLKPGASKATMEPRLARFLDEHLPLNAYSLSSRAKRELHLIPLTELHLRKSMHTALKQPVDASVVAGIGAVGALIVAVAAINFITLMTARAARRAVEVGVRKALGASRRDLIIQFMGEAVIYVLAAAVLALALAELLLPVMNALVQKDLALDYLGDPALSLSILAVVAITALLAGLYPAFVLSSFRPSSVLKGGPVQAVGGGMVRQALVVSQFAVLVGLALVAITIARQTLYAISDGMRIDNDQVLLQFSTPCSEAMRDAVVRVPGVKGAACAFTFGLNLAQNTEQVSVGAQKVELDSATVDFGFFEVFGLDPIAGRLFDKTRPADGALDNPDSHPPVILNESAVKKLGFKSPQDALGKSFVWHGVWDITMRRDGEGVSETPGVRKPSVIVGVVPDFTFGSLRQSITPTFFSIGRIAPPNSIALAMKLDKDADLVKTQKDIEQLWKRIGQGQPYLPTFVDRFTMRHYVDTIIQGATVAVAGIIAMIVASLGLFALSAYTTERRTKEIGVRKAMGASSGDILKLLLWQFAKPVIWANLIAWPAAWLILTWWLSGFVYRVDIAPWTFAAAGGGALFIALATVLVHAMNVARSKPVGALRYE